MVFFRAGLLRALNTVMCIVNIRVTEFCIVFSYIRFFLTTELLKELDFQRTHSHFGGGSLVD